MLGYSGVDDATNASGEANDPPTSFYT